MDTERVRTVANETCTSLSAPSGGARVPVESPCDVATVVETTTDSPPPPLTASQADSTQGQRLLPGHSVEVAMNDRFHQFFQDVCSLNKNIYQEKAALEQQNARLQNQLNALSCDANKLHAELERVHSENQWISTQLMLQKKNADTEQIKFDAEAQRLQGELEVARACEEQLSQECHANKSSKEEAEGRAAALANEIRFLESEKRNLEQSVDAAHRETEAELEKRERQFQAELDEVERCSRAIISEKDEAVAQLQHRFDTTEQERAKLEAAVGEKSRDMVQLRQQVVQFEERENELAEQLQRLADERNQLEASRKRLQTALQQMEEEFKRYREDEASKACQREERYRHELDESGQHTKALNAELTADIAKCIGHLQELERDRDERHAEVEHLRRQMAAAHEGNARIAKEKAALDERIEHLVEQIGERERDVKYLRQTCHDEVAELQRQSHAEKEEVQQEVDALERRLRDSQQRYEDLQALTSSWQEKATVLTEQHRNESQALDEMRSKLSQLTAQMHGKEHQLRQSREEVERIQNSNSETSGELLSLREQASVQRQEKTDLLADYEALQMQVADTAKLNMQLAQALAEKEDELRDAQQQFEQLAIGESRMLERFVDSAPRNLRLHNMNSGRNGDGSAAPSPPLPGHRSIDDGASGDARSHCQYAAALLDDRRGIRRPHAGSADCESARTRRSATETSEPPTGSACTRCSSNVDATNLSSVTLGKNSGAGRHRRHVSHSPPIADETAGLIAILNSSHSSWQRTGQ